MDVGGQNVLYGSLWFLVVPCGVYPSVIMVELLGLERMLCQKATNRVRPTATGWADSRLEAQC